MIEIGLILIVLQYFTILLREQQRFLFGHGTNGLTNLSRRVCIGTNVWVDISAHWHCSITDK